MIEELNDDLLENIVGGDIYNVKKLEIHLSGEYAGDLISTMKNVYVVTPNNHVKFKRNNLEFIFLREEEAIFYNSIINSPENLGENYILDSCMITDSL